MRTIIEADLTWIGHAFERHVRLAIEDGRIVEMGRRLEGRVTRLNRRALLPGFINVHSHAFQRGLRGLGETFPKHDGDFWSWREAMYDLVSQMTRERLYELTLRAYREMLEAGITTVGEFHYLHHASTEDGFAFDEVILHAARDAGIRLVLLQSYYNTGAIGEPLRGGQRRFGCPDVATYWRQFDHLQTLVDGDMQRLGVAPHSVRAVSLPDIAALHAEAERRGLVFHIHVEEQVGEVEQSMKAYGRTPMAALFDTITPNERLTAIHCTHTTAPDMARFIEAGAHVGLCPLTEGNLGDGVAGLPAIVAQGGRVCIGTDSNARISMLEDMRWMEYVQRVTRRKRGVCVTGEGEMAPWLLDAATVHGARSLGIRAGAIEVGAHADFCAIDLDDLSLDDVEDAALAAAIVCGGRDSAVAGACVGGVWVSGRR